MLFNSLEFLLFFPVVTLIFFLLPYKIRWAHLLLASCVFYMAFIPVYILILFLTIIIDYVAGIMIEKAAGSRRKLFLVVSLAANIGVLFFFKYFNFFASNIDALTAAHTIPILKIILPIGLSFHTFQAMSYTIEVYRGHQAAERHLGIYALYVMFYPQLVAGPIERPQNILHQFHEKQDFNYTNVTSGLRLMMWGMIKKVVIADHLFQFTNPVFSKPGGYPGLTIGVAVVFFSFQIFCDFSGYSDIAIGAARVMGFHLMTNFNKPYHSRSISEFWKRWHISLSTWFKDYLYIPLGGNRVAVSRAYFNLFFVFLVSGFWHGANWTFIAWGALHGFYLVFALISAGIRKKFARLLKLNRSFVLNNFLNVTLTFSLVAFAWIFFRANNIADAVTIVRKLVSIPGDIFRCITAKNLAFLRSPLPVRSIIFCASLIGFLELAHLAEIRFKLSRTFAEKPLWVRWALYYSGIAAIIFLGVFEKQQFIYFQF